MPAAITPSGVRDGDPAALAGLCAVRGPSVLAYCRHVAGDTGAAEAAAEAFARFRAAVVETDDPRDLNPEALLINATRAAAASHAPRAQLDVCAGVPLLLAARAGKTIEPDDLERLEQHLESCWACRAPVARFEAAERAYRDPPDPVVEPAIVTQIVAAMAAAAPSAGDEPAAAPNGGEDQPAAGGLPAAGARGSATTATGDEPATELRTLGKTLGSEDPADAPDAAPARPTPRRRPPARTGLVASVLGARGSRRGRARSAPAARASRDPRPRSTPAAGAPMVFVSAPASASARNRGGPPAGLRLPLVLPVAVVLLALLGALFVAGVFGGSDPASSPRVDAPSDRPANRQPAEVVVVPGAEDADAEAVERAKARERARARRARQGAAARKPARKKPAPAPSAAADEPAPAPAPPPPVAATPPAPPAPMRTNGDRRGGSRKVDAGKGATGAEQIPPAEDTSSVPDLAPAPEPAAPPWPPAP
jgi:Meckel syndrome type 1 protein